MGYPEELRDEILGRVLSKSNPGIGKLAKEFGIGRTTIFKWKKEAGLSGRLFCVRPETGPSSKDAFSIRDKLCMIKETFRMNELELGEYCRGKGILPSDLRRWEDEITEETQDLTAAERVELISANRKLQKELDRKNKALAEAAALLVLSKKAEAIWGENEEEK